MPRATLAWPESLVGTPAVTVIERAITRRRLSHSLLITGDELETLQAVAHAIADRLLYPPDAAPGPRFVPDEHPDCFQLRPEGKARQVKAEAMRTFIGKLAVSAAAGDHKVGIVHEAEQMNVATSNIFLKTLEEPPANTTLLVLTTKPYALLPTIRSRCLTFRFPAAGVGFVPDGWRAWLEDYTAWLDRLSAGVTDRAAASDAIFSAYGLVARFGVILDTATGEAVKAQKSDLPADLEDDERVAIETGVANGLRLKLFSGIEHATRDFAQARIATGDDTYRRAFTAAVEKLEGTVRLLRLNLNVQTALEAFLLASLRIWAARR